MKWCGGFNFLYFQAAIVKKKSFFFMGCFESEYRYSYNGHVALGVNMMCCQPALVTRPKCNLYHHFILILELFQIELRTHSKL